MSANVIDIAVVVVVFLSALAGLLRGFVREVLGVLAWVGAIVATLWGFERIRPTAREYISPEWLADFGGGFLLFLSVLVVLSLVAHGIGVIVRKSAVGFLDRTLGLAFGVARGAILLSVAYICLVVLVKPAESWPDWVKEARARPIAHTISVELIRLIPPDLLRSLDLGILRPGGAEGGNGAVPAPGQLMQPAPAAPEQRTEGYRPEERRSLDRVMQTVR